MPPLKNGAQGTRRNTIKAELSDSGPWTAARAEYDQSSAA